MKALLIGGTGTISLSTTQLLLEKGWDVTLLNRGNRPLPQGAKGLVADMADEAAVAEKLRGQNYDVVAQFIAYTPDQVERDIRLFGGITGQYIFISTASAYQKPLALLPITESTPLHNPHWQYSRSKAECEALLMERYRQDGFPATIVRPSHTYDKTKIPVAVHGGSSWQVVRRILDGKRVLVHGDGASLWALTHSRDFAKGFVGLMGNPHALGQAVHITSDELLCWNDVYRAISRALGVEHRPAYVPSDLLAAAGKKEGYDFEGGLLGDKAVSVIFDNTKLKRLVPGFQATTCFADGVRESIEYFKAHPEMQREDPAFDAFCDRVIAAMDAARASLV